MLGKLVPSSSTSCCKRNMDMLSHVYWILVISLLLLVGVWLYLGARSSQTSSHSQGSPRSLLPRRLRPRSPLDCPACCLASLTTSVQESTRTPVRPWRGLKSRR